jgi:hypothetical protein
MALQTTLLARRLTLGLICSFSVWLPLPATALEPAPAGAPPAAPNPPALIALADQPVVIEAVGLSLRVPAGALVNTTVIDSATSIQIGDGAGRWTMTIAAPRTAKLTSTVADAAEQALKDILMTDIVKDARSGEVVGSRGLIIDRVRDLRVPGSTTPGERFYVSLPINDGQRIVRGIALFKPMPERFVKFELACNEADLPTARQAFELSIASLIFADPQTVLSVRQNAIKAGAAWLARLTPADYAAAVDSQGTEDRTWFRFYKPSPTGAPADTEERGFRALRFFTGTRAMIDPRITSDQPGPANPEGFLAEVRARLLNRNLKGSLEIIDVEARYFMTPDREQEAWSIKTAVWDGQSAKPGLFTETGTRTGRTFSVLVNAPGEPSKTIKPALPPEAYITQVETFLLPRLLLRSGVETDIGLYAYQSSAEAVSLRRDRLLRGRTGDPKGWTITSQPRETDPPQRYEFDEQGRPTRGELAESIIVEPIELEALVKLWEERGLPITNADDARSPGKAGTGRGKNR